MERYIKSPKDRNQLSIEPMCLNDMISEDSEVRALEVIIDKMDIRSLGFTLHIVKQNIPAGNHTTLLICSNSTLTAILTAYAHREK
jgi:hypothetical protein